MENGEGWLSPKTQAAGPLPLCLRENNQSQACPHLSLQTRWMYTLQRETKDLRGNN